MKKILFFAFAVALLSSCNYKSKAYKDLERQKDSLMTVKMQQERDMAEYLDIVNSVEESFNRIKEAQQYVTVNASGERLEGTVRERLANDMSLIQEILEKNRQQINDLERKNTNLSQELQRSLSALRASISEKETMIANLQEELMKKDVEIGELNTKVSELTQDVDLLETARKRNEAQIREQDTQLHTAWYIAKSKRELRDMGLVERSGFLGMGGRQVLEQDFDRTNFVRIDIREVSSIEVASSNPKILTRHAEDTYTIRKGNNTSVIEIKNADFWRVSRYLVVQF